ncbi:Putative Camp independent regulatory protein [[Torrubiella] hemipterigena]|uniref:Putative Camp independent regulatory protein n=1 Tax=[Torrubiella] hemipterigena TaxID=1531966 RepID=A0A0A1T5F4_9HYPO|nr:Putative Camp independent regulatory protein [[Torrubiella] hemipterigena]
MSSQSRTLQPTFKGYIGTTLDALVLFEACLAGKLDHVARRPHDRERQDLIKSGNIFIYEEHSSGIKRWTDGVSWSPSRILGNFLIYRELDKPFPPGEKKRALKKNKKIPQGIVKPEDQLPMMGGMEMDSLNARQAAERALIGSLVDSYAFKEDGLVKKTISVTHGGVSHHMVSYYNVRDVLEGTLAHPTKTPGLEDCVPRPELIMSQNFRAPVEESEMGSFDAGQQSMLASFSSMGSGTNPVHLNMMREQAAHRHRGSQDMHSHPMMAPHLQQPVLPHPIHHAQHHEQHESSFHPSHAHNSLQGPGSNPAYSFGPHNMPQQPGQAQLPPPMQHMGTFVQHPTPFNMEPRQYHTHEPSRASEWPYETSETTADDQYFVGSQAAFGTTPNYWSTSANGM